MSLKKEQLAFNDLVASLDAIEWLSVYTEAGKAGGRGWSLEISRGDNIFPRAFGSRDKVNGYNLTLMVNGNQAPADLSERLSVIDDAITYDRRRGGNAQTTTQDEAGWVVGEDEGRESFSISTSISIRIHEAK